MEFLTNLFTSNDINIQTATLRLILSFIAGGIIGYEREAHKQPAGLRTHMIICIGSTLTMLLSYLAVTKTNIDADPTRIAAQVVSGIGFIGAGAILKMGVNVRGLTTAASIWTIAIIGLAIGAGFYFISFLTLALMLITLIVMEFIEGKIFKRHITRILTIELQNCDDEQDIISFLKEKEINVIEQNRFYKKGNSAIISFTITAKQGTHWGQQTKDLATMNGVESIEITVPVSSK